MVGGRQFRPRSLICESDGRDTLAAPYGLRAREREWLVVGDLVGLGGFDLPGLAGFACLGRG